MAKGQKRSTRELKKPKADKKALPVANTPFARQPPPQKRPPSARDEG